MPCSDSRSFVERRSSVAARVSIDGCTGDQITTSGTDDNVDNPRTLPRHHHKHSTLKDQGQADEVDGIVEHRQTERVLSSGQLIKSVWNNVDEDVDNSKSSPKKKRARNKNVNASTQTIFVDDNFQERENHHPRFPEDQCVQKDGGNDGVDSQQLANMIRLLAAPILASEVKTALVESTHHRGKFSSPDITDVRSTLSHHNHHHHRRHRQHQQQTEYRSPWQLTADIMARPPVVKVTPYDTNRAPGRPPTARDSTSSGDRCPYCAHCRRPPSSNQCAVETTSSTEEERTTLDQLLVEMCRYCDRDCGSGETAAQLKTRLKRAILAKYFHK